MRDPRRSLIFDLSVFLGSIAVLGYFGWHGYYGPRSVEHSKFVQSEVARYQDTLKDVQKQRDKLDAKVALLRPQSIDPDMLDEMARKTLQFSTDRDFIVLQNSN